LFARRPKDAHIRRMDLQTAFERAVDARAERLDAKHDGAVRLFAGFYEGFPALAVDLYARTLLVHDYAEGEAGDRAAAEQIVALARARFPWIRAAVWKVRGAPDAESRNGALLFGAPGQVDRGIREHDVAYAVALRLNRDASFYLDTRGLRAWAKETLSGLRVLNTFAYTGSLGVAAKAGGAREVVHLDRNKAFLEIAKASYTKNGWPTRRVDFRAEDFFESIGRLKREGGLFDCVFVDPPFFSETDKGKIDLATSATRVLDKVRPLIGDGGYLVAVNNALFLPGADYHRALEALCEGGWLSIERTIPIPDDVKGYPATRVGAPPVDPAPFDHPTKIAILRVKRKDGRKAS
jgi:23S rRNA (cytosine1962-C5)-methyltransferase